MKASILLIALLAQALNATPDHRIITQEEIVGTSATGYAILRTVTDNLGSHYSGQESIWLDEFSKNRQDGEEPRRILLLETVHSIDATHNDPNTPPPIAQNVQQRDERLLWSAILERYPQRAFQAWTAEKRARFSTHPDVGVSFDNRIQVISANTITRDLFPGAAGKLTWQLEEVVEDSNSLYLRINSQDENEVSHSRFVFVPPALAKQIGDRAIMEDLYLVAATVDTLDEALQQSAVLHKRSIENKQPVSLEIWSAWHPVDKIIHHIAVSNTANILLSGKFEATRTALGTDLIPTPSTDFREVTRVPR